MQILKSGGVKFYILEQGEMYPDPHSDNQFVGAYVVFPFEDKWAVQYYDKGRWLDLTELRFDSENAAFNYAYDHYTAVQNKLLATWRRE